MSLKRQLYNAIVETAKEFMSLNTFTYTQKRLLEMYFQYGGIFVNNPTHADEIEDDSTFDDSDLDNELDESATKHPDVQFTRVAREYLSRYILLDSPFSRLDEFEQAGALIEKFLRFVLEKGRFNQFKEDIESAIGVAVKAQTELPLCKTLTRLLPGEWNRACSMCFGGELYEVAQMYLKDRDTNEFNSSIMFKKLYKLLPEDAIKITESVTAKHKARYLLDVVIEDVSDEGILVRDIQPKRNKGSFVIRLEPEIRAKVVKGMYLCAAFHQMTDDQWYMDQVSYLWPSYDTELDS